LGLLGGHSYAYWWATHRCRVGRHISNITSPGGFEFGLCSNKIVMRSIKRQAKVLERVIQPLLLWIHFGLRCNRFVMRMARVLDRATLPLLPLIHLALHLMRP
jgi:hypothetical protein